MRIYVGNLDYTMTSDGLRTLFEPHGTVTWAEVQVKTRTGQSRGFGLVEMPDLAEAESAIAALNGSPHNERPLIVNESRPRRTVRDLYAGGGWFGAALTAIGSTPLLIFTLVRFRLHRTNPSIPTARRLIANRPDRLARSGRFAFRFLRFSAA